MKGLNMYEDDKGTQDEIERYINQMHRVEAGTPECANDLSDIVLVNKKYDGVKKPVILQTGSGWDIKYEKIKVETVRMLEYDVGKGKYKLRSEFDYTDEEILKMFPNGRLIDVLLIAPRE